MRHAVNSWNGLLLATAATIVVPGCLPALNTECNETSDCPSGFRCDPASRSCVRSDAPPTDAAVNDAAVRDSAAGDVARPDTAIGDSARSDLDLPDTRRPDTGQPDTARPDARQPDTWKPVDTDSDGVSDDDELAGLPHGFVTDPASPDTDGDGVADLADPVPTIARCHTQLLYHQDFATDPADWIDVSGTWQSTAEGYRIAQSLPGAKTWIGARAWTDYVYQVRLRPDASNNDVGILFRATSVGAGTNDGRFYYVGFYPGSGQVVFGIMDGAWHPVATVAFLHNVGQWYLVQVSVQGNNIDVRVDGTQVISAVSSFSPSGGIGFRTYRGLATYDDAVVCR